MLKSLTGEEYTYWVAFFSVEGFPEERADRRARDLLKMLATIYRVTTKPPIDQWYDYWQVSGVTDKVDPQQAQQNLDILGMMFKKFGKRQ